MTRRRKPPSRSPIEQAAVRLAHALGVDDCVLVGGLAVGAHGFVRATEDVDFVVRGGLPAARTRLKGHGIASRLVKGSDLQEGHFDCLRGHVDDVPFDILPPIVPIEWERALAVDLGGASLHVVDLDGLLRLKLRAGGPKDLMDVAALVRAHEAYRGRTLEVARAYGIGDKLQAWLDEPRLNR